MRKVNPKTAENIEKLGKEIEEKRKIPKSTKEKIYSKIFENVLYATIILIYLGALNLGMENIPTENYLVDLSVFSILLMVTTIIMFEAAYRKKEETSLWGHGAEVMCVAVFTSCMKSLYNAYYNNLDKNFSNVVMTVVFAVIVYYFVKILVLRRRIIKQYNKSLVDIGEIVKKIGR